MKTRSLLLLLGFSFAFAECVFAQGTFSFQNRGLGLQDAPVSDSHGTPLAGSIFQAELYGGNAPDALAPAVLLFSTQRVPVPFLTGTLAGYFITNTIVSVPSVPGGALAWIQVRAWDMRLGSTYEDAVAHGLGGYGESPLFRVQSGDPFDQFPTPAPLVGLQSFSLRSVIPEPSTWTLLALGAGGVWWATRRQRKGVR